jgi:hypothetical protein
MTHFSLRGLTEARALVTLIWAWRDDKIVKASVFRHDSEAGAHEQLRQVIGESLLPSVRSRR